MVKFQARIREAICRQAKCKDFKPLPVRRGNFGYFDT